MNPTLLYGVRFISARPGNIRYIVVVCSSLYSSLRFGRWCCACTCLSLIINRQPRSKKSTATTSTSTTTKYRIRETSWDTYFLSVSCNCIRCPNMETIPLISLFMTMTKTMLTIDMCEETEKKEPRAFCICLFVVVYVNFIIHCHKRGESNISQNDIVIFCFSISCSLIHSHSLVRRPFFLPHFPFWLYGMSWKTYSSDFRVYVCVFPQFSKKCVE